LIYAAHRAYLLGWDPDRPADSDLAIYRSGVPHWTLNGVLRVRDHDLDDAIAVARHRLDGLPWLWWVGPDSDPGVADGLVARGGKELARLPWWRRRWCRRLSARRRPRSACWPPAARRPRAGHRSRAPAGRR